jgi:hypothetical protein
MLFNCLTNKLWESGVLRKVVFGGLIMLLFLGILTFKLSIRRAVAGTINVPGDYPTIQQAINAAANGDVILVGAGVHDENIVISGKSSISLIGQYADNTIITGHSE